MSAPKIRCDYQGLGGIAQKFGLEAEAARRTQSAIRRAMEALQGGDWMGQGASAFYREMSESVLPSLDRLVRALDDANQVTRQISALMKQAENDAARCLGKTTGAGQSATGLSSLNGALASHDFGQTLGALAGSITPAGLSSTVANLGQAAAKAGLAMSAESLPAGGGQAGIGQGFAALGSGQANAIAVHGPNESENTGQQPDPAANKILNDPNLTVEDKVMLFLMLVAQKQEEEIAKSVAAYMEAAEKAGATQEADNVQGGVLEFVKRLVQMATRNPAQDSQRTQDLARHMEDLQRKIKQHEQIMDTLSKIMETYNQSAQAAINQMGR